MYIRCTRYIYPKCHSNRYNLLLDNRFYPLEIYWPETKEELVVNLDLSSVPQCV